MHLDLPQNSDIKVTVASLCLEVTWPTVVGKLTMGGRLLFTGTVIVL